MVTAASGAGHAGAARRPREGAMGCTYLACLPPRDKVTFCSGSHPNRQPQWHLAEKEESCPQRQRWSRMLGGEGCLRLHRRRVWASEPARWHHSQSARGTRGCPGLAPSPSWHPLPAGVAPGLPSGHPPHYCSLHWLMGGWILYPLF